MRNLAETLRGLGPVWDEPDPVKDPVTEPEPKAEPEAKPEEPKAEAAPAADSWKDRRIAQLTAQKADLARKLNEAPKPQAADPAKPLDPVKDWDQRLEVEARKRAEALVAVQTFNEKCNEVVAKGRTEFGEADFNASVAALQQLVDPSDAGSIANYQDLLESAIETGEGAQLIFDLGKDMNEAERVFALPPKRRAIELAKRAAKAAGNAAEPSSASKPIKIIEPRGGRHEAIEASDAERSDKLSTADWMARRNAEVAAQARR